MDEAAAVGEGEVVATDEDDDEDDDADDDEGQLERWNRLPY